MAAHVIPYEPRQAFKAFHQRASRWSVLVCHRRAGKTVAAVNDVIARALYTPKPNARYAYVAPFHAQAKTLAWDYLLRYTQNIRRYMNVSELTVELINGNRVRLYGADNPDAMRGIYLDGVVLDEPADMKLRIWTEVLLPALADRKGWAVFIGTPKGRNVFYKIFERALQDPAWFTMLLKASESGILPQSELDTIRTEMADDDAYQQEFECNFDAAVRGSYYGKIINAMGNRLMPNVFRSDAGPVHVAFDLGIRDDTAAWFWQVVGKETRFVDYDDASGLSVGEWVQRIRAKPWPYGNIWLPHDAKARSLQTGKSIIEQFHSLGVRAHLVPSISLQNGIQAARHMLERCIIDNVVCKEGLDLLRLYQRLFDTKTQSFAEAPRHDYTSHAADAFRYASLVAHRSPASVESTEVFTSEVPGVRVEPAAKPTAISPPRTLNALWEEHSLGLSHADADRIH